MSLINASITTYYFGIRSALGDRRGVTALEYALIAALIAVAIVGGVNSVATHMQSTFNYLVSKI